MAKLQKIKFEAFTDAQYQQKHGKPIELLLEPEQIKFGNNIRYGKDKQMGTTGGDQKFQGYEPEILQLKLTIDCTGVVEGAQKGDKAYDKVKEIENLLYVYNSDGHSPSYVKIIFGELLFKGRLASITTDYTLFSWQGIPLRASLELSFKKDISSEEDRKRNSKQSPDMSRLITLKEGETLPYLCHKIYGDSLLVRQVARFNNLNSFRNIPAGTELLFPPLKKE